MRRDTKLAVAMGAALAFAPWVSPCQAQFSPFNQIPGPGGVPLNTIGGMPNVPGMMMEQNGNQQFDPQQQQGNRQNRGPGRGVPRFTDPMSLVIQEPVQEELKLTDKQKDKIKLLKDSADQAQRALMPARGFGGRGGNGGGPGGVANNGGPAGGGNGGGRVRGGNAGGAGAGVGGDGGPGNFGGQPGQGGVQGGGANLGGQNGQGGPGGFDWQAMQEAMTALRAKEEAALAKILTPKQLTRLMQITTQKDGPQALIRPDVIQKISIDEDQVTAITEVLSGLQTQQRELRRAEMDQLPKGPSGRPDFQQVEEWRGTKEGQEQAKKAQASQDKLKSQTMKQIAKILYKPQQTAFNKLLGAPFDLSKLQNNGFGGPGGRNRNGNNAATPTATAKAATSKNVKSPGNSAGGRSTKAQVQADDDEEETPAPAAAAKKSSRPTPKASTRSSLRANRGLPDPEN